MNTKDLARGKWQSILPIVAGINAKALNGKHCPCPVTGEGDNRFRFSNKDGRGNYFCACNPDGKGDGFDLIQCARGITFKEAAQEVERSMGIVKEDTAKKEKSAAQIAADLKTVQGSFTKSPLHVEKYLESRGLKRPPTIRQAFTGYGLAGKRFDAMVGIISDPRGKPVSMHLTYLEAGQKAPIDPNRIVMTPKGTIKGGAVRLHEIEPRSGLLCIAEGIESALAASELCAWPAWAVISANGMRDFEVPDEVKFLAIYADADANYTGQAAAFHLANRAKLKRRELLVEIVISETKGQDANDLLKYRDNPGASSHQQGGYFTC